MRHYLDGNAVTGTLIAEPSGTSGIYFEKVRSRRYRGMLRNNIGRVRGVGQILFEEPMAIQILKAAYDKKGIDASLTYQMIDDTGTVLIDSEINFANVRKRRDGWSVTLRDSGYVETLDLQADTFVNITPNREVTLSPLTLAQEKTHSIDPTLARVAWKIPGVVRSLAHFPAWVAETTRANATGDFATVTNVNQQQPIWRNSTGGERRVQLTARLVVSHRSATTSLGRIVAYVIIGNEVISYPAVSISVTSVLQTKTYAIDKIFSIPSGGELFLEVKDFDQTSADFEFNYNTAESYLCVNQDAAIASSTAKVIYLNEAFQQIAAKLAPGLTITNTVLALETDWITNGLQLRGVRSANLKTSFGSLWDDVNRIHPSIMYRDGKNRLTLKAFDDFLAGLGEGVTMRDVSRPPEFYPDLDLLASRIRVGFNRWQSYTPTGREEKYGNEEYSTGLEKADRTLDLVCTDLSASEKLMESVRRLQFDWGGSRMDKDEINDEQIFIKGLNITPKEMLRRWESIWAASSTKLTKTTGSPDTTDATMSGISRYLTGETALVEGALTGAEWAALGDVLNFYDQGQRWRILVNSAMYRPGAAGSGAEANTMVEGWVLKEI
jgi:hypothetical protein